MVSPQNVICATILKRKLERRKEKERKSFLCMKMISSPMEKNAEYWVYYASLCFRNGKNMNIYGVFANVGITTLKIYIIT